ncbi:hypothetical protein PISMIDRAFT_22187 [Pisolithus microcarpus 441]|uniref:Protein kinase domain-containing protein n=1 Tax=Pisolithus microcarpus 441 TaxID=765257 RepID=A0A0D0A580_9AGAM|nr:hypothetical protein PISMIDRAFT_22187 [Pisolithus microcarpus 441]
MSLSQPGRTLGSGTYPVVEGAIRIKTGQCYACKVINKELMEGRELIIRNEIAVLKRISSGHLNIVTLHDYFENLPVHLRSIAAELLRTIFGAIMYIHSCGIAHRNLEPNNLLFRSEPEGTSEIMVADSAMSHIMSDSKSIHDPGDSQKKTGYGTPVEVWAMVVITYLLLAGCAPFDRDTGEQEVEAIIAGDYCFDPATEALRHPWLAAEVPHFVEKDGQPTDLLPHVKKAFDSRRTSRKAAFSSMITKRTSTLVAHLTPDTRSSTKTFSSTQEWGKEVLEHVDAI